MAILGSKIRGNTVLPAKLLLLMLMLLPLVQSGQVYRSMQLVSAVQSSNYTLSVASESQCFAACVGDIKAVSYSEHYNVCRISTCARVQLATSALWNTYVCFSVSPTCSSVPRAMLDWMMTDACGFANTGWLSTGLTMRPFHYGSSTPWSPSYMPSVNVSYFGRAILYPKVQEYMMMTDYINNIPMAYTDSVTLFAYFWLYDSTANFPLIEFAYADANGNYQGFGPEFWMLNGGIYYNFGSMCQSACYGMVYAYPPPANQWISTALVINASTSIASAYVNGSLVWNGNVAFQYSNYMNFITTGGRPGNGLMNGTTYCLRIYRAALTAAQLREVAISCILPTPMTKQKCGNRRAKWTSENQNCKNESQ